MGPLGHSMAALAAIAGLPAVAVAWLARPSLRGGLGERLGAFPVAQGPAPIWIHGASVGETTAASGLVEALQARGTSVVTSSTTLTGRALARERRPEVPSALAPLDHPWVVGRALDRVRPSALILIETELWPFWIRAASERGIPVLILSGRISDRSFPRYRRLRGLLASTLRRIDAIGARSERDAERYVALGAPSKRVHVTGDLKLEPSTSARAIAPELDALLGTAPLFVAGSTHPGEEAAALEALAAVESQGHAVALVLAPRRPERWDEVAHQVGQSGRRLVRRSDPTAEPVGAGEVLLLDTLGELGTLWSRATVAFVGGTLAPVGGHNVLEPVQAGRAVIFGPHLENVKHASARLIEAGAGVPLKDASELAAAVLGALRDGEAWLRRGSDGLAALADHEGSTARSLALLDQVLGAEL